MTIYNQLSDKCNCITVNEADVDELIHLMSVYTCWSEKPCDTFLVGDRREVLELPDCLDECQVFTFEPFYHPFDVESFRFTLIAQTGIEETSTAITDFSYSEIDDNFKMLLPLPDCKCGCQPKCGCPTKYKLLVEYIAGYEELPECLIPIFCEALQFIKEKNNCDCDKCQKCDAKYEDDRTEILIDNSATLTDQLKNYFVRTLAMQYRRQLSLISLCKRPDELWGFRV